MIEHISIKNFKSIGAAEVSLSPMTVLIGRSGVGKSNFLRAIRFLRNYLIAGERAVEHEGGWNRIWPYGSPQDLSLEVRFRLPGFDQPFAYALTWSAVRQSHMLLLSEQLLLGNDTIFSWKDTSWAAWPGGGAAPREANHQIHLNKFPTAPEAVLAFTAWTSAIGWHEFPATVLSGGPKGRSIFGDGTDASRGLDDDASNYLAVIKDITQDLRDQTARRQILARLKQINPTVRSLELDSIQTPKAVVVGHELGGVRVALELSQESDGFRRYYAHLLALYQSSPKQVLMFEEPENGIYPGALRNLSEEFAAAPQSGRGQVLLTTQSPDLLHGFQAEQIRVVELDPQTQQTRIGPLDPDQAEAVRERLLEPGELLTVDMARVGTGVS